MTNGYIPGGTNQHSKLIWIDQETTPSSQKATSLRELRRRSNINSMGRIKMRKTQYETWCEGCRDMIQDVLLEFVDIPGRSCIEEVSIHCANCNYELLRGK